MHHGCHDTCKWQSTKELHTHTGPVKLLRSNILLHLRPQARRSCRTEMIGTGRHMKARFVNKEMMYI